MTLPFRPDPKLDLVLERVVDVPRELVWRCWTEPKHLMPWFCPVPWKTTECEIDLRPGGKFYTLMRGPNGEEHRDAGCYLEVVPNERLVWTAALGPGYRPKASHPHVPLFTAVLLFATQGKGTRYTAMVIHKDEKDAQTHREMGFQDGWGAALDQLVTYTKTM